MNIFIIKKLSMKDFCKNFDNFFKLSNIQALISKNNIQVILTGTIFYLKASYKQFKIFYFRCNFRPYWHYRMQYF